MAIQPKTKREKKTSTHTHVSKEAKAKVMLFPIEDEHLDDDEQLLEISPQSISTQSQTDITYVSLILIAGHLIRIRFRPLCRATYDVILWRSGDTSTKYIANEQKKSKRIEMKISVCGFFPLF